MASLTVTTVPSPTLLRSTVQLTGESDSVYSTKQVTPASVCREKATLPPVSDGFSSLGADAAKLNRGMQCRTAQHWTKLVSWADSTKQNGCGQLELVRQSVTLTTVFEPHGSGGFK